MSLVPCPECHARISDSAASCPQCGHADHASRIRRAIAIVIIMLVGALATPAAVLFFLG